MTKINRVFHLKNKWFCFYLFMWQIVWFRIFGYGIHLLKRDDGNIELTILTWENRMRKTILDKLAVLPRAKRASTVIDRIQRAFKSPKNWVSGYWATIDGISEDGQIIQNEDIGEFDLVLLRDGELVETANYSLKVPARLASFCLEGACVYLNGPAEADAKKYIKMAIFQLFPLRGNSGQHDMSFMRWNMVSIPRFNDHDDTTIKDVRKVLRRAAQLARRGERKKKTSK